MKTLFPIIIFLLFPILQAVETVSLKAGTPLFLSEKLSSVRHKLIVLNRDLPDLPVVKRSLYRFEQHPLIRQFPCYQLRMPDGALLWAAPAMRYSPELRRYEYLPPAWALPGAALCLAVSGAFFFCFLRKLKEERPGIFPEYMAPGALLFLHFGAFFLLLHQAAVTGFYPSDEYGYFQIARDLADGSVAGPWRYTIGLGLAYLPAVLLTGAKNFLEVETILTWCNALVITPGALLLCYGIFRKLTGKASTAFGVMFLVSFAAIFHQYRDLFWQGSYLYKSFFALIPSDWHYFLHSKFLLYGYHAGSENLAMLLVFGAVFWSLSDDHTFRRTMGTAALFALSCLVRINDIFFAPLLAFLLWEALEEKERKLPRLVFPTIAGAAVFLLIFGLQFAVNFYHFGSIWTFPYILHPGQVHKGFFLHLVPAGFRFICGVSWFYIVCGTVGLWFVKERKTRIALALWGIPLLVFFAGYPALGAGSTRFLMICYPAFAGALVCADVWRTLPERFAAALAAVIGATVLLTSPGNPKLPLLPWGWEKFSFGTTLVTVCAAVTLIAALILVIRMRFFQKEGYFLMLFLLVWHLHSAALAAALMAAFCLWLLKKECSGKGKGIDQHMAEDRDKKVTAPAVENLENHSHAEEGRESQ